MNDYTYFRLKPTCNGSFHIRVRYVHNQTYKISRSYQDFHMLSTLYELSPAEALASGSILDLEEEEDKLERRRP